MTIKSNLDEAVVDFKNELDSMGFLDPGAYTEVDQDLIDAIEVDMVTLVTNYSATFSTLWGGKEHEPGPWEMAHWLFDGVDPSEHGLTITLYPTNGNEGLAFTTDVPFPWR